MGLSATMRFLSLSLAARKASKLLSPNGSRSHFATVACHNSSSSYLTECSAAIKVASLVMTAPMGAGS
eukprot:8714767-Pyramimonas_sp.AAC.1